MTSPADLVARLNKAIDDMQWGDRPLPWVVHSGCSYRRIASETTRENMRTFADGNVLHAYNQRSDNHPDLSMGERELTAMVEVLNLAPTLASLITQQSARIAELEAELRTERAIQKTYMECRALLKEAADAE